MRSKLHQIHVSVKPMLCILAMPHLILFQTYYYIFILKDIFATLKYVIFQIKNKDGKKPISDGNPL